MGSLILCHNQRARRPYEINRVHLRIWTIEEMCYYLCNNLYLIDSTIMNRGLCDWFDDELGMPVLAEDLRRGMDSNVPLEEFVMTILKGSAIYSQADILKIQNLLTYLQNQKEVEKTKYKADNLFKSGEYASAIQIYQSLINAEWDDTVEKSFYGKVYSCLGASYGKLFLYGEAADMYKKAYGICQDSDILKAYLYACYRAYPEEKYVGMLSGNAIFLSMDALLKEDMREARRRVSPDVELSELENWKNDYRRIDRKNNM